MFTRYSNSNRYGTPPTKQMLDRLFNRFSSGNPETGGLGMSWTDFALPYLLISPKSVDRVHRNYWYVMLPEERLRCGWDK